MCTIGSVFHTYNGMNYNSLFKQCDLETRTSFLSPMLERSPKGIRYVAMTRKKADGSTPAWAGVNEYGVSFVAADSYLDDGKMCNVNDGIFNGTTVFDMYLKLITDFTTAEQAASYACMFYREAFDQPDILMIGDKTSSYFIEAYNGKVKCIERKNGYFASTNHFRMVYGGVPYGKNHSTYLRLNRAEQVLQSRPNLDGIGDVLRDEYFGKTVWSVCRYADNAYVPEEAPYYTQAAVIFNIANNSIPGELPTVMCEYVLNGNASTSKIGFR